MFAKDDERGDIADERGPFGKLRAGSSTTFAVLTSRRMTVGMGSVRLVDGCGAGNETRVLLGGIR